jgi:hypothetical protein
LLIYRKRCGIPDAAWPPGKHRAALGIEKNLIILFGLVITALRFLGLGR